MAHNYNRMMNYQPTEDPFCGYGVQPTQYEPKWGTPSNAVIQSGEGAKKKRSKQKSYSKKKKSNKRITSNPFSSSVKKTNKRSNKKKGAPKKATKTKQFFKPLPIL